MSPLLRRGRLVHLLAMLWLAAECGASQQQPSAGADTGLDQLWAFIDQAVKSATAPLVTGLTSRLDLLESTLERQQTQLGRLESSLDRQQTQLERQESSQLDSVQTELNTPAVPPRDCSDLPAGAQSGIHLIQSGLGGTAPVPAYCDLEADGGSWTVFQRRADMQPRQNFSFGWQAYKEGFGELEAEFWWGLEHLWALTSPRDRLYELRIDLGDFDGEKRHAVYQGFRISSEADGYRLAAANYTGDAGDSLNYHVGYKFSTWDRDHDTSGGNCAKGRKSAWWYQNCQQANLNGRYLSGPISDGTYGVNWYTWRGYTYSLKTVEMKARPTKKI